MTTKINMPKLGMGMLEGGISSWSVADGAHVNAGEPLYVVESDKVETEIDAPVSGTVRIIEAAGSVHPVGTLIAEIET